MEISLTSIAYSITLLALLTWAWRVANWVFFRPKKLERCLRRQGLCGNPYRLLVGDLKEGTMAAQQARSKPIKFSDDPVPRVIPSIYQLVKKHGKNSFTWIGPKPRVIITNPEELRDVFSRISDFHKPSTNPLTKLLANGFANLDGEKWAKRRKIINPAFHLEKLKHMLPAFYESCSEMISKWEKSLSVEHSCELDVWPYLQTMTSDVISRTAFGSSYEEGRKIFKLQKEQAHLTMQAAQSIYIPGLRFLPTKRNKRMMKIDREIQALLKNIISKREKAMNAGKAAKDDLLGILLESNLKEIQEHRNKNDVGMSILDVIEECKLFYFAGQETTSVLLVWTMVLLSKYPTWQARAREEVLQFFGKSRPDLDGLNHLKVVTMILLEVLRLYPPVPMLSRSIPKETKLGNLLLPAGVFVTLPTMLVHYDNELWGDDAAEFKPERFFEGVSKVTKNQVSYFPFGWGPRICIGQNFAMMEAKVALAMILQHFSYELSSSYAHAPHSVITLQPQHGAHLILHKRRV